MFTRTVATAALLFLATCLHSKADDKVFKVGSTPTGIPFTFLNMKTNTIEGVMVDIIKEIARDAGFKVEVEGMQFSTLIPSLTSDKVAIIAAAMYITPDRKEVIEFSNPIYTYGEGLITPKTDTKNYVALSDLKGEVVGAQKGTAYVEPLQKS